MTARACDDARPVSSTLAAEVPDYVMKFLAIAPTLTAEQLAHIRRLLGPPPGTDAPPARLRPPAPVAPRAEAA